ALYPLPRLSANSLTAAPARRALIFFVVSALVFTLLSMISIKHRSDLQRLSMERLIIEKSIGVSNAVARLLSKTQALAALVIQNNGEIPDFERNAAIIMDDPAILNILVAPGGVVSHVYPLEGNEQLVGYNLLGTGAGNKEAVLAKERGRLVLGGPFELMQGGSVLVGRLPVLIPSPETGERHFWGLVSVTLKYPEALHGAGLESLEPEGVAFEIWRTNPDDGQRQVIAASSYAYDASAAYIERHIPILNADWYFRILPVRAWYEYPENWLPIIAGFCISLLLAVIVRNNAELIGIKSGLEQLLRTDALTGVLNREGAMRRLEALLAQGSHFTLFYMDLNHFKQINDSFGHLFGDKVLIEFCRRFERHLNERHILARLGGDEFMLIHVGPHEECGRGSVLWQDIAREFAVPLYAPCTLPVRLSFSVGSARYPEDGTSTDQLITHADACMYEHKRQLYRAEQLKQSRAAEKLHGRQHDCESKGA
ncbi:sensor domain-containing diguanylate cyclase, partial [Desulfovibrio sp. OttesenSCG-928-A18]|nr:sensor domain-containing diguanylate cyclase [Desulfovibrio sp. OttesenSCG-928-A18]